jgi:hypothetical protein
MPLADRYLHWQQGPDEEVVDYVPVDFAEETESRAEDTPADPPIVFPWEEDA